MRVKNLQEWLRDHQSAEATAEEAEPAATERTMQRDREECRARGEQDYEQERRETSGEIEICDNKGGEKGTERYKSKWEFVVELVQRAFIDKVLAYEAT